MHEEAGALDVTKELLAKAGAVARAFDEAGDIGDHELAVIQSCDAEVWRQRGEGIVGDLGTRARESREEGRLSGVRQAREADVREQLELEIDLSALALTAVLRDPRRAPRAGRETRVALPCRSAAREDDLVARRDEVRDGFAGGPVDDERARWDGQHTIRPGATGPVPSATRLSRLGLDLLGEAKIGERPELGIDTKHDVAASTAVAAIGAAARHVGLAAERDHTSTAVAGLQDDPRAIDEHCYSVPAQPGAAGRSGVTK